MASCITLARIVQALLDALEDCQGGGPAFPSERVPRGIAPDHRANVAQFPYSSEKKACVTAVAHSGKTGFGNAAADSRWTKVR